MLLPLAFQFRDLHPTGRVLQIGIVCAIALLLFAADWVGLRITRQRHQFLDETPAKRWRFVAGLGFAVPLAAHLYLMPKIPLLAILQDTATSESAMTMLRLEAGKLMHVPSILMYLFNWALVVFAPVYIVSSWLTIHRRQAVAGLLFAGAYAAATWAKLPIALLVLTCLFAGCVVPGRWRPGFCAGVIGLVLAAVLFLATLFAAGSLQHLKNPGNHAQAAVLQDMQVDDPRRALTVGDNFRFESARPEGNGSELKDVLEYVVYRGWLTPSDVSNRWYQFFTYAHVTPLGVRSLLRSHDQSGAAEQAPSRQVGLWAYRSRFPDRYWDTINAYASFDADAFARGGVVGVFIATIVFVIVRIGSAWLLTSHPVGQAAYAVLLCGLAILLPVASTQAILGANGLFLIPVMLCLIRWQTATQPQSHLLPT
ncbi:MAG: hypothetical protein ABI434_04495 [Burkholderiaceae bacterium]